MKHITIIGAGIAGMETAACLAERGHQVTLVEKSGNIGGNTANWHKLFPTIRDASEVMEHLKSRVAQPSISLKVNASVGEIKPSHKGFTVDIGGQKHEADAIVVATGYQLFDSTRKEEFGYGIYDNVFTSSDLEAVFRSGKPFATKAGKEPSRIAMIHCVGSRDEKSGNHYCSKVCCVTAVKQAIELRHTLPRTEIICFYIDLRMFGAGYEELYREAQERWGIQFVRGRLSEAAENQDGSLQIKAEDTLSGRPLKMKIDAMVLMAGMEPSAGTRSLATQLKLDTRMGSFLKPTDEHLCHNRCRNEGIFVTGTCTGPMTITETLADARAAAVEVERYLGSN